MSVDLGGRRWMSVDVGGYRWTPAGVCGWLWTSVVAGGCLWMSVYSFTSVCLGAEIARPSERRQVTDLISVWAPDTTPDTVGV